MLPTPLARGPQRLVRFILLVATAFLIALGPLGIAQEPPVKPPFVVKIVDEKPTETVVVAVGHTGPIDPTQHIQLQNAGNMMVNMRVNNQTMHLGFIQTLFHLDGQVVYPGNQGQLRVQNQPLPVKKGGKARSGSYSVYEHGKLTITQEVEVVPTKAVKPDQKRRLDSAMVTYIIENKDDKPHKFGLRIFMDVYVVDNDGALFAAPNQPNKILNGVELKGKMVPDYLQFLQRPDLTNPGFVAHMTYKLGKAFEMPDRLVLTTLGAQIDQWNLAAQQAGDSAMGVFWDPKEIKAGVNKKLAYAYGQGIAPSPEGDGNVVVGLGGSFEPGKLFTVSAHVLDPAPGQNVRLELPAGMELVEGKERQPVPIREDDANSMVLWKARVRNPGQFAVRVHSSTGITQTKIVTITSNK